MMRRRAPLPPLAGAPSLTQGSYGDVGNLELLAPAADGGLWVFWFNADEVEHRQGAARRCWSGGLHLFGGHDVTQARITQVNAGPNFLEALARTGSGNLHRLYWTPRDGFVGAGIIASDVRSTSAIVETATGFQVLALLADGSMVDLLASADDYPALTWSTRPAEDSDPAAVRSDVAVVGPTVLALDGNGTFAGVRARSITACRTVLDGGRIDVVLADVDGLVHLHGDGRNWSQPHRIVSEVWAEPTAPVHRRQPA